MADFSFFLPLPKKTKILIKEEEKVEEGQKVATFNRFKKSQINLAQEMGLSPQKTGSCLLVKLGQKITKEELIAKNNSLLKKITVKSPVSGQVLAFDSNTGILTIETAGKNRDLLSPFSGKIEKIGQEGITIQIKAEKVFDLEKTWGNNVFGQLAYHGGALTAFDCQFQKKIVLTQQVYPALINKAQAIGSLAIISDDIADPSSINFDQLTIAKTTSEEVEELKKFLDCWLIIDSQQKKVAVLQKWQLKIFATWFSCWRF